MRVSKDKAVTGSSSDADPDSGSGDFLPLDPGWKKSESGSGMNIPDNFSESLETVFLGVKNT
jgi:hypothetical protein